MGKFKRYIFIIFIVVVSFFALKNLWGSYFYTSHDGQSHLARLYEFDRILKEGQFPPRWAGQFSGERGYPVFIFAYPLPYAVGELFYVIGFNLAESLKLTIVLFYVLSGLAMYWLVKEIFKNDLAAFTAGILYTWAPYRFVKIFVTASLGESMAFAFVPLILLFIYKLILKNKKSSFIGLALSICGLILTHLITLIIFLPLFCCFIFWCLKLSKQRILKIKQLVLAGLLSLGLSAFYLLSAVYEIRFTHYREVLTKNYFQQFVRPIELLYSKWGYGVPNIGPDGLSLQVGLAQWLVIGLSVIFFVCLLVKKRKELPKEFWLGLIVLGNFFLAIFLMLVVSKPIWDLLPPLQSVDTPWRFLSLAVFCSAFLDGFLIWSIYKINIRFRLLLIALYFLTVLSLAFYSNRNHLRVNAWVDWDENYFKNYYWVGSGWNEYVPRWARQKPFQLPPEKVIETDCKVEDLKTKSHLVEFGLVCDNDSSVLVNRYYYPGWLLYVNNVEINDGLLPKEGILYFNASIGYSQIKIVFKETSWRLAADIISIASILLLINISVRRKTIFGIK